MFYSVLWTSTRTSTIWWKTIFSPLLCLCSFAKDELTITCEFISELSVFLICLSVISPLSHCIDNCNYTSKPESCNVSPPTLFHSFNAVLAIFHINFRKTKYPQNNLLRFWWGLHWINRSHWEQLTSWQYWVFQSISIKYLSIYLVLLWFLLLQFWAFPHTDLVHILLDLYLFHFGGDSNVNSIMI